MQKERANVIQQRVAGVLLLGSCDCAGNCLFPKLNDGNTVFASVAFELSKERPHIRQKCESSGDSLLQFEHFKIIFLHL
jgi:hypothetical protein